MPFDEKDLPKWNSAGVEPPDSKKSSGFGPGEKPPADWFNWLFSRTYLALKNLFANAQNKEEKGKANGYAALDANGKVPSDQLNIQAPADATTTVKGIVQLTDSVTSTSIETAATPKSVKTAYDLANGKYTKPTNGIPKTDLDSSVQTSLGKADTALQSAPVSSVNNKTGAINLTAADVGAAPSSHTHPASIIIQDTNNRFVSDTEKANWNAKASTAVATTTTNGLMSSTDKSKLDGIANNANNYVHPTGDGNQHVPATGTGNNKKVLKAGTTAGSVAWGNVDWSELTGKPSTFTPSGHNHPISEVTNLQNSLDSKANASDLAKHQADTTSHITASERTKWNGAVTDIGTKTSLKTSVKTDLVSAINEVFQSGNNVKQAMVDKLLSVDPSLPITYQSTWAEIEAAAGQISTGLKFIAGDTLTIYSDNKESNISGGTSRSGMVVKSVRAKKSGTLRVSFNLRYSGTTNGRGYGQIYINGSPRGIRRDITETNYVTFVEDINVESGDELQLYLASPLSDFYTPYSYTQDFKITIELSEGHPLEKIK